jgi:hypothetical protein
MVAYSCLCILFFASVLPGFEVAGAQSRPTDDGTVQLAGTAQLVRHKTGGGSATVFELAPRIGYFVMSGWALNINLTYSRVSEGGEATNVWGLGPGVTYYPGRLSPRVYPFVSARTLFTWQHTPQRDIFSPEVYIRTTNWLVSAGGLFLLADHVGLTGEFFYQRSHLTHEVVTDGMSSTGISPSRSWGIQWGVAVFLD